MENKDLYPISLTLVILGAIHVLIRTANNFKKSSLEWQESFKSEFITTKRSFERERLKQLDNYKKHEEKSHDILRKSINQGKFIMLSGVDVLRYISNNIDNYSAIYNIRVRVSEKDPPEKVKRAVELWRKAINDAFESESELTFQEIVAFDDSLIKTSKETKNIYENNIGRCAEAGISYKKTYEGYYLSENSNEFLLRNFMIFETKHFKKKELYWGWYDPNQKVEGVPLPFNTYYTTDDDMVDDYVQRYNSLLRIAEDNPI